MHRIYFKQKNRYIAVEAFCKASIPTSSELEPTPKAFGALINSQMLVLCFSSNVINFQTQKNLYIAVEAFCKASIPTSSELEPTPKAFGALIKSQMLVLCFSSNVINFKTQKNLYITAEAFCKAPPLGLEPTPKAFGAQINSQMLVSDFSSNFMEISGYFCRF